ncbi:MAG TPA: 1,2-phenylacetyl-CoA epoxidase subunit PaaD [Anaerolineales bacterium]|nr:1,2-phenylacetyl-CoA epoxidase subunit PaaD [Anaerolineales bacterium]
MERTDRENELTPPAAKQQEDELTSEKIWQILETIQDPEIPVVSVVEMGMIRSVGLDGQKVIIQFAPTFAGCPALDVIQTEIKQRLLELGAREVQVQVKYSPPWSSDWITPEARQKLKRFGLAPPPFHAGRLERALEQAAVCPFCGSQETRLANSFGPTLCRAIYVCTRCSQPFEQFKPL